MGEIPQLSIMALKNTELLQKQRRQSLGEQVSDIESGLESSVGSQAERLRGWGFKAYLGMCVVGFLMGRKSCKDTSCKRKFKRSNLLGCRGRDTGCGCLGSWRRNSSATLAFWDPLLKSGPAMQGTSRGRVRSLGREDPLEEGMATHSSVLAWKNPLDRGAWWATVHRVTKSWTWLKRLSM